MRPLGMPFSNRFWTAHLAFLERLSTSSCAKEASSVSISSPSSDSELMDSFSNRTSTPSSFRRRTVLSRSTVFRAKRLMDLVSTMSMLPASHAASMSWNPARSSLVPVAPPSEKTPAYSQPGVSWMSLL